MCSTHRGGLRLRNACLSIGSCCIHLEGCLVATWFWLTPLSYPHFCTSITVLTRLCHSCGCQTTAVLAPRSPCRAVAARSAALLVESVSYTAVATLPMTGAPMCPGGSSTAIAGAPLLLTPLCDTVVAVATLRMSLSVAAVATRWFTPPLLSPYGWLSRRYRGYFRFLSAVASPVFPTSQCHNCGCYNTIFWLCGGYVAVYMEPLQCRGRGYSVYEDTAA